MNQPAAGFETVDENPQPLKILGTIGFGQYPVAEKDGQTYLYKETAKGLKWIICGVESVFFSEQSPKENIVPTSALTDEFFQNNHTNETIATANDITVAVWIDREKTIQVRYIKGGFPGRDIQFTDNTEKQFCLKNLFTNGTY